MHQSGQGHAGAHHIGSEGMTKPVGVGLRDPAAESVMAKQGAQSGGGHGVSTMAAFERNKQSRRVGQRSFQMQVVFENSESVGWQGHEAFLPSLAEDVETSFGKGQVLQLELEDFERAQAV